MTARLPNRTPPIVSVTATAAPLEPGYVLLTRDNGAGTDGPTIVYRDGGLVWLRPSSGRAAADFAVATYRGDPVLTWWEGTLTGGIGSGEFILADAVVGSSPRLGFKTAVTVATGEPIVAVRAVDATGVVLGTSTVVRADG